MGLHGTSLGPHYRTGRRRVAGPVARLSARMPRAPLRHGSVYGGWAVGWNRRESGGVSTRKLIIAAFVCGMVILLAGALQFLQIAHEQHAGGGSNTPAVQTTVGR
ncbi:MAG: hypothetical protein NVSMB12_21500 [Acidimicrobiales bacterium]